MTEIARLYKPIMNIDFSLTYYLINEIVTCISYDPIGTFIDQQNTRQCRTKRKNIMVGAEKLNVGLQTSQGS